MDRGGRMHWLPCEKRVILYSEAIRCRVGSMGVLISSAVRRFKLRTHIRLGRALTQQRSAANVHDARYIRLHPAEVLGLRCPRPFSAAHPCAPTPTLTHPPRTHARSPRPEWIGLGTHQNRTSLTAFPPRPAPSQDSLNGKRFLHQNTAVVAVVAVESGDTALK